MYCRNCGKAVTAQAEYCMNCGARPMNATAFCNNCGNATTALSEICVKCGVRLSASGAVPTASKKSNSSSSLWLSIAIAVAVFLMIIALATDNEWAPGFIGLGSFVVGLTWTVVATMRKESRRPGLILGAVGFCLFIIAGIAT